METLKINCQSGINAMNAGYFISRGVGTHPERVMDSWEIIFVEQGKLSMFEGDCKFEIDAGGALLLFPGRKHGGTADYPADLRFFWIHFSLNVSGFAHNPENSENNADWLQIPQTVQLSEPERLVWLLRRYLDDQEQGILTPVSAGSLLQLMFCELDRSARISAIKNSAEFVLAQKVEEILQTRFHEPVSTADIAKELRYSADHIARQYRRAFGRNILTGLHLCRLKHARSLLLNSGHNINEIALESGFSDPSQFRKVFRRHEGMSPGAYRSLFARAYINTL